MKFAWLRVIIQPNADTFQQVLVDAQPIGWWKALKWFVGSIAIRQPAWLIPLLGTGSNTDYQTREWLTSIALNLSFNVIPPCLFLLSTFYVGKQMGGTGQLPDFLYLTSVWSIALVILSIPLIFLPQFLTILSILLIGIQCYFFTVSLKIIHSLNWFESSLIGIVLPTLIWAILLGITFYLNHFQPF